MAQSPILLRHIKDTEICIFVKERRQIGGKKRELLMGEISGRIDEQIYRQFRDTYEISLHKILEKICKRPRQESHRVPY